MAMNASIKKRGGDEFYTKRETIEKLITIYGGIFQDYGLIWLPFNSKGKPIEEVFTNIYGKSKIVTTPDSCYNEEFGFNDFWKWKEDINFYKKIISNKTLVFDNPHFSESTKVFRELFEHKIDVILFSDSMTGLNKVNSLGVGYHILGRVPFDNSDIKKRINVGLFSNLFKTIKYVYGVGTDKADNSYNTMKWNEKVNIPKYRDERNGEICSAELINVCLRGYEFHLNKIKGKGKKFGGSIFYDF